jgi:DUF971 family protein
VLQTGKRDIDIQALDAVGSYAAQHRISDGHDTGIYSWDYVYELGVAQNRLWAGCLARLNATRVSRDSVRAHTSINR